MKIENAFYRLKVDDVTGAIYSVYDKAGGVEFIAESRLAENYRLLLPLPDLETNYFLSNEQHISSIQTTENTLILHWDGPLSNDKGHLDLGVTVQITLVDAGKTLSVSDECLLVAVEE